MNDNLDLRKIRWGILGCAGVAAAVALPGIRQSRNGTLKAIASRESSKAHEFAERFGIEKEYGHYEEVLSDPDLDAVYIPLPNALHHEWTLKAARKGKHVLCEKPLARNAEEAREMAQACRESEVLLMEAFAYRFHPQNLLVKRIIAEGRIGRIVGITAVHSSGLPSRAGDVRLSRELAGGVLMDKGCYCIDVARFLMESEPVSVFAKVDFHPMAGVDERVTAMLEFPSRVRALFDTSYQLHDGAYQQGYEVHGETGRIRVPWGFVQLETYRSNKMVDTAIQITDLLSLNTETVSIPSAHQWKLEFEYFADCVLNREKIRFPSEDGQLNMKVIDAVYESAKRGLPVTLR
ncbi:MAG: Gfo/Idh/MocA family oxidoreductase [Acidobacteria bacterium]|nr:Gfo/Idh/MocA family oxidoreductase [Acidobacteriota bacterium]